MTHGQWPKHQGTAAFLADQETLSTLLSAVTSITAQLRLEGSTRERGKTKNQASTPRGCALVPCKRIMDQYGWTSICDAIGSLDPSCLGCIVSSIGGSTTHVAHVSPHSSCAAFPPCRRKLQSACLPRGASTRATKACGHTLPLKVRRPLLIDSERMPPCCACAVCCPQLRHIGRVIPLTNGPVSKTLK